MKRNKLFKLKSGKEVQIYLLPAGAGLATATKLFKAFAPTLASLVGSMQREEDFDFMSLSFTVVEGLDNIEVAELVSVLLRELAIDGMEVNFDEYFMANYAELLEILGVALKENFGSFLELKGFVDQYLPLQKDESSQVE